MFFDDKIDKCSLDHLKLEESSRLTEFYEKYGHRPFKITEEVRIKWSRVVQGRDDNKEFECQGNNKPYLIHYVDERNRNEIEPGLLNTMSVLAKICGVSDAYEKIMTESKISKDSIVEKLTKFFNKICNKNVRIKIEGSGIKEITLKNSSDFVGDFYITLDLTNSKTTVGMKLCISQGHTTFFFESVKLEIEKVDSTIPENLSSDNNTIILSSIISRYFKLINNNDDKTDNFDYPFEVLYNQGVVRTNEQKRDQCSHLCEFIGNNYIFDHRKTKKVIENIIKSANLSDPATRDIFQPLFIYIDDKIFAKMPNYEVIETWMFVYSEQSHINSQSVRKIWNEAFKNSSMKIRSIGFSDSYVQSVDDAEIILSATKDTLENLKLKFCSDSEDTEDSEKFIQMVKNFLIGNETLESLTISPRELSLSDILDILKLLENNKLVKTLDVSYIYEFNDDDAKILACALKNNTSLTTLNFSGFLSKEISGKCLADIIGTNKTLTALDISSSDIKSKDFEMIAAALKDNTTLTTLRISNCDLNDENIKYLAAALELNKTLISLDISENPNIGSDGIECIADALKNNTTLTALNISETRYSDVRDKFAQSTSRIIQNNIALTSLNISKNNLNSSDAEHTAEALRSNTTLTTLDISDNDLHNEGTKHIARIFVENKAPEESGTLTFSVRANKTLTNLNISSNYIENKSAESLADLIEKSESLVCLDLSNNRFKNDGISRIANALAKNKLLKVFNIQSSDISAEDSMKILDALKENKSLVEFGLTCLDSKEMAECIAGTLKDVRNLKTLDVLLPNYDFIEKRISLYKAIITQNTTLDKVIFRKDTDNYIIISDRMPIGRNPDCQVENKSLEFQSIEIYYE